MPREGEGPGGCSSTAGFGGICLVLTGDTAEEAPLKSLPPSRPVRVSRRAPAASCGGASPGLWALKQLRRVRGAVLSNGARPQTTERRDAGGEGPGGSGCAPAPLWGRGCGREGEATHAGWRSSAAKEGCPQSRVSVTWCPLTCDRDRRWRYERRRRRTSPRAERSTVPGSGSE